MNTKKEIIPSNEKGFALVAAIIASLILLAMGLLVFSMSTDDLLTSTVPLGNKKAIAAAESAVHRLVQDFNTDPSTWITANNYTPAATCNPTIGSPDYTSANFIWRSIPNGTDANTKFAICQPYTPPPSMGASIPVPGGGDKVYFRYNVSVVGKNTTYNSIMPVDVGIGYGPVSPQ